MTGPWHNKLISALTGHSLMLLQLYLYTKKKVKHPHVFLKWQIIRQVSRDYW
jgi:hypothetical protein